MTALPHIQYFLGANSPAGFYSLYDHLLPPERARAIYILKGGPGCGKSTLMRKIGAWAEESGLETEYILCSGDPDSLDAVVFPDKAAAIVDGTAPHVVVSLGLWGVCWGRPPGRPARIRAAEGGGPYIKTAKKP